ncbi:heavy metal translocating P-type ATPase [Streptomyces buecherae]|uniref:Heavy metal translocating P-type ATPase n=1 Tax=Streptomyces buecherae TaxID=2763006 RepID=A0A7H8N2G6_9ACTN|nr:heavy metal translocating P-type ATPase [Streptomyces buecherae]QKW48513.1 heavy metal translocating P-type ATPase [Streptomyces buecherae]
MISRDDCAGADTLRLDITDLIPGPPAACEPCVERVVISLGRSKAIDTAHRAPRDARAVGTVCVHFDAAALGAEEVRQAARTVGARTGCAHGDRGTAGRRAPEGPPSPPAAGPDGARATAVTARPPAEADALATTPPGVHAEPAAESAVEVSTEAPARSHGQDPAHGGTRAHRRDHQHSHDHDHGPFGERAELVFALLSGVAYLTGLLLGLTTDAPEPASLACYLAAYAFGGFFTVREAVSTIRAGRFEVDFLMLVAAVGAGAIGRWAEGAVLLFLFSLGHALEEYAMGRARRSIEALADLTPATALLRSGERVTEVPVERLLPGDTVLVRPHTRVPADGFVRDGEGAVDQAAVTGESLPADKVPVADPLAALRDPAAIAPDSRVFAGTVNGAGALEVTVTSRAEDNTLARVVAMVRDAENRQSPTQAFTARFQRIFVPAVIGTVLALLGAGLVVDEPFTASLYRAMAVLVAASPCALAIATPAAVLSAVARAARSGVLIKGGGPLEELGRLTAVAFDKTGTLTEGRPRLTDVAPARGVSERELLTTALAVERLSDHPLARAVVRDLDARLGDAPVPTAHSLRAVTGRGVLARLGGVPVAIGSPAFFPAGGRAHPEPAEPSGPALPSELRARAEELETAGRTTMVVRHGARYLGVIGVMDTPRPEAAAVVARLRGLGIRRAVMISGDNQRVADAVAARVGLDEAWGDLLPADKVAAVRRLRADEHRTAMVGDGVNDAPAMAHATVGIAMGAAGSAVALESADIALMSDGLGKLPLATGLSRRTSAVIRQNLLLSLGIVAVLLPATVLGLGIGPAVLVHEGSTLLVVANALRLLRYPEHA